MLENAMNALTDRTPTAIVSEDRIELYWDGGPVNHRVSLHACAGALTCGSCMSLPKPNLSDLHVPADYALTRQV